GRQSGHGPAASRGESGGPHDLLPYRSGGRAGSELPDGAARVLIRTLPPNDPLTRTVALNAQEWIGAFLQSDGAPTSQPTPTALFEMPIVGPLPETLNFIP